MNISFTNYNKALPQALLKQAQKLKVRDLDESNPKEFVAYVDDKSESFDVNLKLDTKKNVISSSCDCEQGGSYCVHKTALLIHLSDNVKTKAPAKARAKKLDPLEVLLNQTDAENLRTWLFPLLKKNSELKFLFEKEFIVSQKVFVVEDIDVIIEDAVKSVIGRRKSIQTNEVAKLVSMLEVALQPVLNFVENDIKNVNNVLLILKMNDVLIDFHYGKHVSSVKLIRLVEKINQQFFGHINNIQDLDLWKKHLDFFFSNVFKLKGNNINIVTEFLKNTYELAKLSPFKLEYFIFKMRDWFHDADKSLIRFSDVLSLFVLDFYIENKMLSQYSSDFQIRRFSDEYNLKLINALIELEDFDIAAMRCKQVIQSNQSEAYNIPYFRILKQIYQSNENIDELAELLKTTLKFQFSFEELSFLAKHLKPEDYKQTVTVLKRYFRANFYSNPKTAPRIYFGILLLEENYKQIFSDFHSHLPFDMIYENRIAFYNYNKKLFWDKLLDYNDYSGYNNFDNQSIKMQLVQWAYETYRAEMISYSEKRLFNPKSSPFFRDFMALYKEKFKK